MVALAFAWSYAILLFMLTAEADTFVLQLSGFLAGTWMAIAGAWAGYERFRV